MTQANQEAPAQVTCPATRDPSVRKFLVAAMLIGFGAWCFYDGFVAVKKAGDTDDFNRNASMLFNRGGAIVLPLIGLVPLAWGLRDLRRVLVADAEGIGYLGKKHIAWSEVTGLDASDASKGVLRLNYRRTGREETLVLDRWRLRNFRELAQLLENRLSTAKA
jgi:hypothetical protein